jgi:prevent-host-death family protein
MSTSVPKSKFKPKAFEYFRLVEETKTEILITDHGKPVAKIVPYKPSDEEDLLALRGLVEHFEDPTAPIETDWDALK